MKQYCIDSSSIMSVWKQSPPDVFPDLWQVIENFLAERRFILPVATFQEVMRQDDGLAKIIKSHKESIFHLNQKIFEIQTELVEKYNPRNNATAVNENDLAIVATAKHMQLTLVTEEGWQSPKKDSRQDVPPDNFKIPRVCKGENIYFCRMVYVFFELWNTN